MNGEIDESQNEKKVKEIITCPICCSIVKTPYSCPKCQTFICKECLIIHYTEKNKVYCPKCRTQVRYDEFSPMPIIDNVSNFFIKNQNEQNNEINLDFEYEDKDNKNIFCDKHGYELIFYCLDCEKNLCGECIESFNNKKNIHENHNVYQIKDLKKYNLFEPIKKYQELIKDKNNYNEYLNKCDYNINYLNCIEEIRQKHLEEFHNMIDEKMRKLVEEKEKKKEKIIQEKKKLEEIYPPLNILLNKILDENNDEEFNIIKNKIKNFNNNSNNIESSIILSSKEIKVLSIDLFESKQIIFDNILKIPINEISEEKECIVSNIKITTSINYSTNEKIRFEVKFNKENYKNKTSTEYLVSILLKNHKRNTNEIINLKYNKKENYYWFIQLYKYNSLYDSADSEGTIVLNIILSEMKLTLE